MFIHGHIALKNYSEVFCRLVRRNSNQIKINANKNIAIFKIKQEIFGLSDLQTVCFLSSKKKHLNARFNRRKAEEANPGEKDWNI